MTEEIKNIKRGPGRPRKNPVKADTPPLGILTAPNDPTNAVEATYARPGDFKKLASYYHGLQAEKIMLGFDKDKMHIYTMDYKDTTYVRGRGAGSKMTSYYATGVHAAIINFDNFHILFKGLNASYTSVQFIIKKNKPKTVFLILETPKMRKLVEWDTIEDEKFAKMFADKFVAIPSKFAFKLDGDTFKTQVTDMERFCAPWCMFASIGATPAEQDTLHFTYKNKSGQTKCHEVPSNLKEVIVSKDLKPGAMFTVSVLTENLKPTSAALLSDTINFVANDSQFLYMWVDIGGGCFHVDILVKVIDNRPQAAYPAAEAKNSGS